MIEGENEKDYRFFAIILLLIQSFIIGIFLIFFVAVSKVNAADYNTLNPNLIYTDLLNSNGGISQGGTCAWNDLASCNRDLNTTSNQRLRMKFQASYYSSASNSIQVNYIVGYKMFLLDQQVNLYIQNMSVGYYSNNSLVKDISSDCTTTAQKVSGTGGTSIHPLKIVYFIMTTTCDFINPGANADNIVITTPLPTAISNIENVYARISSYTLNRITGTVTDSDKIIANNTQNTQWIINNIESGTTTITNSIDNSTNQITNQLNETEQNIINSNKVCRNKVFFPTNIGIDNKYLNSTGVEVSSSSGNYAISNYIALNETSVLKMTKSYTSDDYMCFYDNNKSVISCLQQRNININTSINIPNNAAFFRFTISKILQQPTFDLYTCKNGNQTLSEDMQDINGAITDSNVDINSLPSVQINTGPISAILSMPVELAISVLNGIDGTCSSYTIGSLFGHTLTLPCVNIPNIIGQNLWTTIDIIISGIFAFSFRRKLIDLWNALIHLRTAKIGSDEL